MRNRLCIIILLVVWIGQPFARVSDEALSLRVSRWAVWRSPENLAELVVYQVSRLMLVILSQIRAQSIGIE